MARGPEAVFWNWLRRRVGSRWNAQRHEDSNDLGIPDVSFGACGIDGWLELKALARRPVRSFKIDHLTKEQVLWLEERGEAGSGCCWLCLRLGMDVALIRYGRARCLLGRSVTQAQVYELARGYWPEGQFDADQFLACAVS